MPITDHLRYTLDEAVDKLGYGRFQQRLQFIAGLVWAADAIEVVILSIIGGYLACDWGTLYRWQNALLSSCVFAGIGTGCPIFGKVADKYGRKKSIIITLIIMFLSGAASAASPSYYWMLGLRIVTGFSLGGIAQVLTLTCEYVPTKYRGVAGFYICFFWAFGTLLVILLAWAIMMTTKNWRLLLGIAALPSFIVILCMKWCPESPRYLLVCNEVEAAEKILARVAKVNKKTLPPGSLLSLTDCSDRGLVTQLFCEKYRLSTFLFWYMTFASAFGYYGIVFLSPYIIEKGNIYSDDHFTNSTKQRYEDYVPCKEMTGDNYIDLAWTSASELVGLTIITLLVWRVNRKPLLFYTCVVSAVMIFLLLLRKPKIVILLCLFSARGLLLSAFQLLFIMTSESYPTTLRAVALGTTSGWARVGGLIIPYVVQVMVVKHPVEAIAFLGLIVLIAGALSLLLPIETRGMRLEESISSSVVALTNINESSKL